MCHKNEFVMYEVMRELSDNELANIKMFEVEYFEDKENAFIVTNDDQFYVIGCNRDGMLGLNHKNEVKELTKIEVLCGKQIVDIKCSTYIAAVLTKCGHIYVWFGIDEDFEVNRPHSPQQ